MKFFSKIQIFGVALATLVAFGFTGCDEVKSLAASVSIEEPLVTIEYNSQGQPYLSVQSQDNDTIIEDVIINRGNCETDEYEYKFAWGTYTYISQSAYDGLDNEEKGRWTAIYPKKLPYGEKFGVGSSCNANSIIEVELVVNGGGRLTYNFK